jgi:hypothetical protein
VRQPTHFQRNWVQYTALGMLSVYALESGVRHVRNGNARRVLETAALIIESNIREHIMDPLGGLRTHSVAFDRLVNVVLRLYY